MKLGIKTVAALLGSGLLIVGITVATRPHRCPDYYLEVSAGERGSREAAIRASIKRLSVEIRQCPNAGQYRIIWDVRSKGVTVAHSSTLYDRKRKRLGWEGDPWSGFEEYWEAVDEASIHLVAEQGGGFEYFARASENGKLTAWPNKVTGANHGQR